MFVWVDRLHATVRSWRWLNYFTAITRVLLAIGFIIPSLPKITHVPFTQVGTDTLVGYYFDALYQSGFYYQFIGYGQLIAGLLLLIPRTATIGAFAYFPIIINICVLTWSIDFPGTKYITSLMLLANIYLLCWDYDRWRGILPTWQRIPKTFQWQGYLLWGALCGAGAALAFLGLAYLNIAMLNDSVSTLLPMALIGGILFGFFIHWHAQQLEKSNLVQPSAELSGD